VAYDLQAAGEYVLLRSADAAVEIQARTEPRGAGSDMTINTAVAARVNDHRVVVSVGAPALQVRVDGQVADLGSPMDLGSGGRVVQYANGIEIDLTDGSRLYALARSKCCLNIVISPSDGLRSDGRGLLGEVAAGGLPVPALPDGTRLPRAENAHDRFTAIYEQLAPAWLATDATTLFDYAPGKTTASYLVPGFPAEARTRSVEDLTSTERAVAETKCANVADPDLLLNCMFDVTVSDLEQWADLYGLTDRFIKGGTDVLDSSRPDPDALPGGFVELLPDVRSVLGAAIGPDRMLYVSVQETGTRFAVLAVDLATGVVRARLDTSGGGRVAIAGGMVWVGGLAESGPCAVSALDPGNLALRASVPLPCDFVGSTFVAFDDAIWFLDRTTADGDGRGGRLRRVDPRTNTISGDVVVGFVNGTLFASADALFWLGRPSLSSRPEDSALYRLLPGEGQLTSLGAVGDASLYPAGVGVWSVPQPGGPAVFRSSAGDPDRTVAIEGVLAGVDDTALYVNRVSTFDATSELWRYPVDGSPPDRLAVGVSLQTATRTQALSYVDSDPLLFGEGSAVKLWVIPGRVDAARDSLVMQATPLP
jgi:hypothetical protein